MMHDANLGIEPLALALRISRSHLIECVNDPYLFKLDELIRLASILSIDPSVLVYLIIRNKRRLDKNDKWYLEELEKNRMNSTLNI